MTDPSSPSREQRRLDALHDLDIVDTPPEADYDDIAHLAALVCGAPIALLTLVTRDRVWFKARRGVPVGDVAREGAFCATAIETPAQALVVDDARIDPRFAGRDAGPGFEGVRFYAGVPIVDDAGHALGTVCVLDHAPRRLDASQLAGLRALSRQAGRLLALRRLSEHRAAREAVTRAEVERLLALAMSGLDLQSFVDPDLTYRYVNEPYLRYWGLPRERVEGRPARELFGDAVFDAHVRPRLARAFAGETVHYHAEFDFPALGRRHMEVTYLPSRAADGRVHGVVVRAHDVQALMDAEASLRSANAQLEARNAALQRFVHLLSHDLCEPVNTIVNFSTLLHERVAVGLTPEARCWLAFVRTGGTRMRTLLHDLIELLRLERIEPAYSQVALDDVMREVLADLDAALMTARARVDVKPLPVVSGERTLLRLMLQNLVANAIKYVHPDRTPRVTVQAETRLDAWRIAVHDNGIGIPEEKCEAVFEIFQRLHPRSRYEGSGMGLSICRQIVQMHGGRIEVESRVGVGSVFRVTLPRPTH